MQELDLDIDDLSCCAMEQTAYFRTIGYVLPAEGVHKGNRGARSSNCNIAPTCWWEAINPRC
jgi:hypothetical protein